MKENERFIELWTDYLEGELDESGTVELRALLAADEDLLRLAADSYEMHRMLGFIAQESDSRHETFVSETMARLPAGDSDFVEGVMQRLGRGATGKGKRTGVLDAKWRMAIAAAAAIVVIANVLLLRPEPEKRIARITGLSGSLQWTGDNGRVFHDLNLGAELPGGTVEGMTPESWFELQFNDGSAVTISGNSTLTFSDLGQKKLYLKEGSISAQVKPQRKDKPMRVFTRSAMLEVLGTQFEVEAELGATTLNVGEGKVRIKRLSDGVTVDVPAMHRLVASADREMRPVPAPGAVNSWRSQLHLGPDGAYGKWSPKTPFEQAKLRAIPLTIPQGLTIYTAAFGVSRGDTPPVVLQPGCRLRLRGHVASNNDVYFGITVMYPGGGFAGRFETIRAAAEFLSGQDFEVLLDLVGFQLDPSLTEIKNKLPNAPYHLVLESVWCHTLDRPSGLEITEVELLPSATSVNTPPTELPVMDIWAATSQGNLAVVKSHLAAGVDTDAAFMAPGVIASGATPLHMAVLSDQREVARLLIAEGTNINTTAKDEYGGTPLHWAAALGRVEIARQLIDAGADVNARDNNGYTPLDATALDQYSEKKFRLAIAELLQECGGVRKQSVQE